MVASEGAQGLPLHRHRRRRGPQPSTRLRSGPRRGVGEAVAVVHPPVSPKTLQLCLSDAANGVATPRRGHGGGGGQAEAAAGPPCLMPLRRLRLLRVAGTAAEPCPAACGMAAAAGLLSPRRLTTRLQRRRYFGGRRHQWRHHPPRRPLPSASQGQVRLRLSICAASKCCGPC